MTCATCGAENPPGQKFCGECGSPVTAVCATCGTPNPPGQKFCGECGSVLVTDRHKPESAAAAVPVAERKLVSVLFADLVGFTSASETRDTEETRDLLSRYFDTCQSVIERYGGTVEKFIGDAVMAVWGTPVSQEDDAERAVRAALELVDAIVAMGADVGAPELRARAGILTGEAAVTLGAQSQGMVAGDLVNTASRAQSVAEPGTVLVGDSTKHASEAAIAFEDAGEHEVRGKTEPLHLWRALRVVANRGGEGRSAGLEAPFVGRERELRMVKELFDASAEEGRAHLVLVTGIAGVGKSRLSWEFEKYVDGVARDVWWHRGRCLSYGDGVAYWALAEMVRGRAEILENEDADSALAKLHDAVNRYVPIEDDRAWIAPRLAQLLGLEQRSTFEREDLFGAWRLFFEHLAQAGPLVLVFEDLQWADVGLLDWIEYVLEWSRNLPIFVVGLARPELHDRRAGFGSASRAFTQLSLEPLAPEAMEALLDGLVPGLPVDLRVAILERAEGIPLYAVETVRMLMSRGDLERSDGVYRVAGEIGALAVPETLHALVASRLDHLTADERRIVQDASVLGKTFVRHALAALSGTGDDELEPILQGLVRKEILFLEADPRSPERGQYGFLQDLFRHVAYETLARRDRKARHLAAARYFEEAWEGREQEIVEVVASHYLTALELDPESEDASELRQTALGVLVRAAERARSLGANAEAAAAFARASGLADDDVEGARLLGRAGAANEAAGNPKKAHAQITAAVDVLETSGDPHALARALEELGLIEFQAGRPAEATARMERALSALSGQEPSEELASLTAQLARWYFFSGEIELAEERNEIALDLAESLLVPDALSHALNTAGLIAENRGRPETALALLRRALEIALEHDLAGTAFRAYNNLGHLEHQAGNFEAARDSERRSLELSRRLGDLRREWIGRGEIANAAFELGEWDDEITAVEAEIPPNITPLGLVTNLSAIARHRGDMEGARRALALGARLEASGNVQDRNVYLEALHENLMVEGRFDEALAVAERSLTDDLLMEEPIARDVTPLNGIEAALLLGRTERADELLAGLESRRPGALKPPVRAHTLRFRAQVAAARGDDAKAESSFKAAAGMFDEYSMVFWLAAARLEYAEWLLAKNRADEAAGLADDARETFDRLRATPWLERAEALAGERRAPVPASG